MAHLAQIASEFRIGLKLLVAATVTVALIFALIKGGELAKNILFPTPPPLPEEKFGKLPEVRFPSQDLKELEYRINTLTGKLPVFNACKVIDGKYFCQMKVYKVKKREPSLIALRTTRENLESIGYKENESKISDREYQWNNSSDQVIRINILTGNFKIYSNFLQEEPAPLTGLGTKKSESYDLITKFLEDLKLETADLDKEAATQLFLKIENGTLSRSQSLSEANFVRLDLFQKNLDKYKIYYPRLSESLMHFILKYGHNISSIVDASFIHLIADLSNSSTYPIKTAEAAFEDLKNGNALIFLEDENAKAIDIGDVLLGYYIGDENQEYFLPIVIFRGKGFTAYVQAIDITLNPKQFKGSVSN